MPKVYGNLSDVDWTNVIAVIAYAKRLGPGMVVYKVEGRSNYNITHADRFLSERYEGTIMHVT